MRESPGTRRAPKHSNTVSTSASEVVSSQVMPTAPSSRRRSIPRTAAAASTAAGSAWLTTTVSNNSSCHTASPWACREAASVVARS